MQWPHNPVAASLQRLSELAGPMDKVRLTAGVEVAGGMLLGVMWPIGDRSPDPDMAEEIGHGIRVESWDRPADTTIAIPGVDVATADGWMYETAWALGSGYLHRWMYAPRIQIWEDRSEIPAGAAVALGHAWGVSTHLINGEPITDGASLSEMVIEAARHGYWTWEFSVEYRVKEWNPHAGRAGSTEWAAAGDTHEPDGSRSSVPPDRSSWEPTWLATIAMSYERLTEPEAAVLEIGCDLVHRRYKV